MIGPLSMFLISYLTSYLSKIILHASITNGSCQLSTRNNTRSPGFKSHPACKPWLYGRFATASKNGSNCSALVMLTIGGQRGFCFSISGGVSNFGLFLITFSVLVVVM